MCSAGSQTLIPSRTQQRRMTRQRKLRTAQFSSAASTALPLHRILRLGENFISDPQRSPVSHVSRTQLRTRGLWTRHPEWVKQTHQAQASLGPGSTWHRACRWAARARRTVSGGVSSQLRDLWIIPGGRTCAFPFWVSLLSVPSVCSSHPQPCLHATGHAKVTGDPRSCHRPG